MTTEDLSRRSINIVPVTITEAKVFVANFHRHNKAPQGGLFAVGAAHSDNGLIGVAVVGRPTARALQDGFTCEVTRCCVVDNAPKGACSALYGACWRAARALGWRRIITYTLQSESGASLRGAGWRVLAECKPRNPSGWQSRAGRDWQPVVGQAKFRWGME